MVRERNVALCVIFTIITCGIYGLYWFVCITDDINTISQDYSTSGVMSLLLSFITCNIYGFYWAYKCGEKLDNVKTAQGYPSSNSGLLYLILYFFCGIVTFAILQNELNKFTINNTKY